MMEKTLLLFIVAFIIVEFLLERWLDFINLNFWKNTIPKEMEGFIDEEKYLKTQEYEKTKKKVSLYSSSISLVITVLVLLTREFGRLYQNISTFSESEYIRTLAFFGVIFLFSSIISLPFSIYNTFVIEEKFGFNKYTLKLFIIDKIKGALLGGLFGGALICLLLFFFTIAGTWFWIYAWVAVATISLFITTFYTSLIVPLFNKLKPLEEGSLKNKIQQYAEKVNFPLKNIMVIDGSKRSAKSNAYFSGIGARKSIVLYDTLIEQQSEDELVAVIAHEVGHYKKKHILKNFIISFAQMALMFYLLGLAFNEPIFSKILGADTSAFAVSLIGFFLLFQPISFIIGILMSMLSRKYEFEADHYAKTTFSGHHLSLALKKLSTANLSNLTPHPLYVFFHYSHPPVIERLKALENN